MKRSRVKANHFRTTVNGRRRYINPVTSDRLPSVTTILGTMYNREALENWKLRNLADHCLELAMDGNLPPSRLQIDSVDDSQWHYYRDKIIKDSRSFDAAEYGTLVHDLVEAIHYELHDEIDYLMTKDAADEAYESATNIHEWIDKNGFDIEYCERPAFHTEYAGTIDMILKVRKTGRLVMADIKTGKSIDYNTAGELQIAAYAAADFIVSDAGEVVEVKDLDLSARGIIIHAPSDVGIVTDGKIVDFNVAGPDWLAVLAWYERRQRSRN